MLASKSSTIGAGRDKESLGDLGLRRVRDWKLSMNCANRDGIGRTHDMSSVRFDGFRIFPLTVLRSDWCEIRLHLAMGKAVHLSSLLAADVSGRQHSDELCGQRAFVVHPPCVRSRVVTSSHQSNFAIPPGRARLTSHGLPCSLFINALHLGSPFQP